MDLHKISTGGVWRFVFFGNLYHCFIGGAACVLSCELLYDVLHQHIQIASQLSEQSKNTGITFEIAFVFARFGS